MAILKVMKLGAEVLRRPASEIEPKDLKTGTLPRASSTTCARRWSSTPGRASPPPRWRAPVRALLYMVEPAGKRGSGLEVPPTILVNPSFEVLDPKEVEDWEACLSVPFLAARVPGPRKIRVRALVGDGEAGRVRRGGLPRPGRPPRERPPRRRRLPRPGEGPRLDPLHDRLLTPWTTDPALREARLDPPEVQARLHLQRDQGPARGRRPSPDGARSVEEVAAETGCTTGSCHGERCVPVDPRDAPTESG